MHTTFTGNLIPKFHPENFDIFFDDILLVKNCRSLGKDIEKRATEILKKDEFTIRAIETIKFTTWLVFLPVFFVASMATYFNMLPLKRLEDGQKSGAMLVNFKSSIALTIDLNAGGKKEASIYTCDLSIDYVKINADNRT